LYSKEHTEYQDDELGGEIHPSLFSEIRDESAKQQSCILYPDLIGVRFGSVAVIDGEYSRIAELGWQADIQSGYIHDIDRPLLAVCGRESFIWLCSFVRNRDAQL